MAGYIFGNAAEADTMGRFASLDGLYNDRTFRFLDATGIAAGWRCLEIGGGSGTVAAWMAERVGPSGRVLVTDLDLRFLERAQRPANIDLLRHDIGTEPLPEAAFDLIHARLVLGHVAQRDAALPRLVAALKPRGWLVIEEFDGRLHDRAGPIGDAATADLFRKVYRAFASVMDDRGYDGAWPQRLYGLLKAAGLVEVGMDGHLAVREGDSLATRIDTSNFSQIRDEAVAKGYITNAEVDALLARITAPDFTVFSPVMFTIWGRAR